MNPSEAAAVIASAAAAVSAAATTWYGLLTLRMVRTTNASLGFVQRQTDEVLRTRIDARAPRVAVRSLAVDDVPRIAIGTDGRGLRAVRESTLPVDGASADRQLVVTAHVKLANEGEITAWIGLPANASAEQTGVTNVVLPPGAQVEIEVRVSAPVRVWAEAATSRTPVEDVATFIIDDSFQDGVMDHLVLLIRAFAVAPGDDADHVITESESRVALGLVSTIDVQPIVRRYRMLSTEAVASSEHTKVASLRV